MQFKRILVTGSEGFIGSHLIEKLIKSGYDVKAMVLYNSFNNKGWLGNLPPHILNHLNIVYGDVRDSYSVRKIMEDCDAVIHLAALIAIPYSYHNPEAYIQTNVIGTLNILQAAKELNLKKIVHISTSEVYGTAQFVPITEEHPLNAQSPYAASKIAADQLALSFHRSFNLPIAIARPFNTYGPRQSLRAVIPSIITQILNGKSEIELGAIHPTRDFNFVEDTANGLIAVLNSEHSIGEVINIGSNFEISIQSTVESIAGILNRPIKIKNVSERMRPKNSEVERLFSCNKKAFKLIKWSPNHGGQNGFREGLQKTIEWFSQVQNLNLYKDAYVL